MALTLQPLSLATLDALKVDALVVFLGADERPPFGLGGLLDWRLCGGLSRRILDGVLHGEGGEALLMPTPTLAGKRLFVFGRGAGRPSTQQFEQQARDAARSVEKAGAGSLAIGLAEHVPAEAGVEAIARAFAGWKDDVILLVDEDELRRRTPELVERIRRAG